MRRISISGKYISDSIGFCHYEGHPGALNRKLARKHKCLAKNCKYLEKYSEDAWECKKNRKD